MASRPPITPTRMKLAEVMRDGLEMTALPSTPATPQPGTCFVRPRPGRPYLDLVNGTWTEPVVNLSVVVVAGMTDYAKALDWLDLKAAAAWDTLDANPSLDGFVSEVVIEEVSEPGLINSQFLAIRLDFAPMFITPQETP